MAELGVEASRFYEAFDMGFYRKHGLGMGVWPPDDASFAPPRLSQREAVRQMPVSEGTKRDLLRVYEGGSDRLSDPSIIGERSFLRKISYEDFLVEYYGIRNPELWKTFHAATAGSMALGIDAIGGWDAISYGGLPGLPKALARKLFEWDYGDHPEPYIFHFPDGNASIARLLVRSLITGGPGRRPDSSRRTARAAITRRRCSTTRWS